MPGFKEVYHEELDRENWGLIKAAQVDSYKGFIFACMDPRSSVLSRSIWVMLDACALIWLPKRARKS